MKIGILDCDDIAPELVDDFKSYANMFEALFERVDMGDIEPEYVVYKACHSELPADVKECAAYLITGSKTGVYDDVPWREPLRQCVQSIFEAERPMVGICFGHQLLADVLGGKAEKSEKGWGIGAMTHALRETTKPFEDMPDSLTLLFSHQDQVTALPDNAVRLYGSDFCENGAFVIDRRALAFQGHPEFTKDYSERLMRLRQDRYPEQRFEQGIASLSSDTQEQRVAQWMFNFLTRR